METGMRRRLAGLTVALVVVVPLSVVAARWQWNRHLERDALNAAVMQAEQTNPVPWNTLTGPTAPEWRRVTATGRWVPTEQLLVRRQTVNRQPGFTVLTPFDVADGSNARLLVVRGWVSDTIDAQAPNVIPAPPSGEVTIVARIRAVQGDGPMRPSDLPPGQINRVDPAQFPSDWWGGRERTTAVYELIDPVPSGLVALPWPELTSGPHLSYFVQWILIGCTGVIVYVRVFQSEVRASRREEDVTPST